MTYIPFYSEIKDIAKKTREIKSKGGFVYGLKCMVKLWKINPSSDDLNKMGFFKK